ncbi:sigma-70 family RNA polymerase sigma factor [Stieleria sp. ICT_E10.1]|uniref:RNA polymerase sigma factor n=1 Tax=Stieleria sedimenti TaxID=2976331 RepID=UPI00217FB6F4|nr:sigma-70 family RNA polymerase sigma factor [Stieleria sedimenti]MCS7465112.1 sigma-70 family RNA polymerase sigma factor [Stieleria sedimenti]
MITQVKKRHRDDGRGDRNLVQRMLRGEQRAFGEFVNRYQDRLFTSMLVHTGSRHDAEDIVQETFIKAFQHLSGFQHKSQLYTWIYRIAWNTSVSRSRSCRDEISLEVCGAESSTSAPESSQPHVPLERQEHVAMLRRALGEIELRHRKILLLREFEERSYREIAEIMEIPLGTVRSRLSRARERLRDELAHLDSVSGIPAGQARRPNVPALVQADSRVPEGGESRRPR